MARAPRERSASGIYHVMVRGINKQPIFQMHKDWLRYLKVLEGVQEKAPYTLHAYCLMDNHVHLLLQEEKEPIGDTMKRIGTSYVYWFNKKYSRVGHLFQARFRSEAVEDDSYFLTVLRYIHQNPVRAKIVDRCSAYPWSSYKAYASGNRKSGVLVDTSLGFSVMGGREPLLRFMNTPNDDCCLDIENDNRITDSEFLGIADSLLNGASISRLADMKPERRNELLRQMKAVEGASIRQIARLTGLGRWLITNA